MSPSTIRALEELLRRVLRSPGHGIDPGPQVAAARARAATYRYRRRTLVAVAVALGLAALALGWFSGRSGLLG